ncbi:putative 3-oxoacyl--synthase [Nemania sp. NC0429]|nr:putative 3-oxoacyl--synthase [Nemania sp. NC0429]
MRRVVVTGLGAVTPLGIGVRRTWNKLLAGHSGIVNIADIKDLEPQAQWLQVPSKVAGLVPKPGLEPRYTPKLSNTDNIALWRPDRWLSGAEQRRMPDFTQYAMAAAEMALDDAAWKPKKEADLEETGVCMGSGIGNLNEIYWAARDHDIRGLRGISPYFVPRTLINLAAGHIAMKYGFRGPNHAVTTACTTGAHSIGDASRFIALGDADVMVAGGAESCINSLVFGGFSRSRSLSTGFNDKPHQSCRPFDKLRDGFVIGEGAAALVLEELEHAKSRGARIYAEIRGYGCSGDAYHMTAPREDGSGAALAMKKALRQAGIKPHEVDYINAHATGTALGDAAEARAIGSLMLGEEGRTKSSHVNVSSTKGAIGHLLGAAGAIEAIFCILAINEDMLPPTANLTESDVEPMFNLIPHNPQEKEVNVALSNSFGFGGTNASLVFSKYS